MVVKQEGLQPQHDTNDTIPRGIVPEPRRSWKFASTGIEFTNNFAGGRLADVKQIGPNEFELLFRSENLPPINDSAWYAFQVRNRSGHRERTLTLHFKYDPSYVRYIEEKNKERVAEGKPPLTVHRYPPKMSTDGKKWQEIDPKQVMITADPERSGATVRLSAGRDPLYVAAHELIGSEKIEGWIDQLVAQKLFVHKSYAGRSATGERNVIRVDLTDPSVSATQNKPYIVLFGRLHPPEVTGTVALMAFMEALAGDSELAKKFRAKFDVVAFPLMNPDGVDLGTWRHTAQGRDLNRDWAKFNLAETQAVRDSLLSMKDRQAAFAIDFHSTYRDTVYFHKEGTSGVRHPEVKEWLERVAERMPEYRFQAEPEELDLQDPRYSMDWLSLALGAPSLTYEVGDLTPRDQTSKIANEAAVALMEYLLTKKYEGKSADSGESPGLPPPGAGCP